MDGVVFYLFGCGEFLTRIANAVWATNQWKCRAYFVTSNAGENLVAGSDCNKSSKNICLPEGFDDVGLRYVGGRWVWLEIRLYDQWKESRLQQYWAPNLESMEVNSESNPLEWKDGRGS
ncbi:hypothetical protein Tco_0739177 [Tanacetum coccineum]